MGIYNSYDAILQNGETEQDAIDYARGMAWNEIECTECSIANAQHIDTVDGIEVYYDFSADYYFFCPSSEG
jgi:hypothetical protein